MLFHEIAFDLMAALENERVLDSERQHTVRRASAAKVLGSCVLDRTNFRGNLRGLAQLFGLRKGESEYQRAEFLCKYVLKKNLRRKAAQGRQPAKVPSARD